MVESLKAKGARFVEDLSEVPPDAVTIFSAHGVAKSVEDEAASRNLPVLNATCPLVTKVHNQGKRYVGQGRQLILIGHENVFGRNGAVGLELEDPMPIRLLLLKQRASRCLNVLFQCACVGAGHPVRLACVN